MYVEMSILKQSYVQGKRMSGWHGVGWGELEVLTICPERRTSMRQGKIDKGLQVAF
jgi:hypothetical protein